MALLGRIRSLVHFLWLHHEIDAQQTVIETQKATIDTLSKQGGKMVLSTCGDKGRLCVEVNQEDSNNLWTSRDKKHSYVIPSGY